MKRLFEPGAQLKQIPQKEKMCYPRGKMYYPKWASFLR